MGLLWDEPYGMGYVINETVIWDSNCKVGQILYLTIMNEW